LSDEPKSSSPPSPRPPVRHSDSASWDQDTSRWDCGAGRYVDQAGHRGLSSEGGFMRRRAPECEQRLGTQPPRFPVPSAPSSPPICTCVSCESNVASVAYSMPVPTYMGLHTTLRPPSPAAEVTTLRYEEQPGPGTHNQQSPCWNTIARAQTTFTDGRQSPHPYGCLDRSTTFPGIPSCSTPGFPVPQLHASYHQS